MGELRRAQGSGGLYERLLQRLALALDEAENMGRASAEPARELELRDLTTAEVELIRAYLDRDLNWLRGWHAAAQELAVIEKWPGQVAKPRRSVVRFPSSRSLAKNKPPGKRQIQLCCALCGVVADWQAGEGVHACLSCGSQLFRARDHR